MYRSILGSEFNGTQGARFKTPYAGLSWNFTSFVLIAAAFSILAIHMGHILRQENRSSSVSTVYCSSCQLLYDA